MESETFFDRLHGKLASKHNLSAELIGSVRSLHLGFGKNRKEISVWATAKLPLPYYRGHGGRTGKRRASKKRYQEIIELVNLCSDKAWQDIVQKTKHDK